MPPPGTIGSVDVRGADPGTHETDALDPSTLVPAIDAVVLTGGSAGARKTAVVFPSPAVWCPSCLPRRSLTWAGTGTSQRGPARPWGTRQHSRPSPHRKGPTSYAGMWGQAPEAAIGAGRFSGGLGTASVRLSGENQHIVVGALAVVNAAGLPWQPGKPAPAAGEGLNTTLVVVDTNARITVAEAKRTSTPARAGMARALNPVHTLADGDTIFTLATGTGTLVMSPDVPFGAMIELQSAAAEAVRLAIGDGIAHAAAVTTPVRTWLPFPGPQESI